MAEGPAPAAGEGLDALLGGGRPSHAAFVVPDDGQVLSYAQLAERVETLAGRLAAAGVRRGDRVALTLPNSPDFVQLLLAVTVLGAAAAPLNPAYTEPENTFYLEDVAPRLLLGPASLPAAAAAAAAATGTAVLGVADVAGGPPDLLRDGEPVTGRAGFERGTPDDVAIVLHTSGTTSRPKQVPLLHRNLMASTRSVAAHFQLGPDDVSFCVMPLFHVHGLIASTFAALSAGGTVVSPRRLTPQRFWRQAREAGTTWLSAGPTLHQMLLDKIDDDGAPGTLRFVARAARRCRPSCCIGPRAATACRAGGLRDDRGQPPDGRRTRCRPASGMPGSVGVPTGTEIGIVDAERRLRCRRARPARSSSAGPA